MKILAVGMNYAEHNKELNNTFLPTVPVIFSKPESALLREGKPFFVPDFAERFDYETEIVVRINRLGKNIAERFAYRYYSEITVGIDITARDLQQQLRKEGLPWDICKGFDGSAIIGDFVDKSEFEDINKIRFSLQIDQQTVQEGCTKDMLFSIDQIVAYASRFFTLKTGDLIFTGTPAGIGQIKEGQLLEGFIEGRKLLETKIK
ncbi:MAG: fumarylacetoacetate hydrolase family protein [Bacteroides sp.]|nr:fumarylacetoacetate hydrolase family protein [Roseburia sp.]MCM1346223.1 fumarylacetoacetate hydrolase family protein [Bacteroides sp.]MCM1420700.1 fumarylacetoacetate hydrolase family protein [Bacteroides sp.]